MVHVQVLRGVGGAGGSCIASNPQSPAPKLGGGNPNPDFEEELPGGRGGGKFSVAFLGVSECSSSCGRCLGAVFRACFTAGAAGCAFTDILVNVSLKDLKTNVRARNAQPICRTHDIS